MPAVKRKIVPGSTATRFFRAKKAKQTASTKRASSAAAAYPKRRRTGYKSRTSSARSGARHAGFNPQFNKSLAFPSNQSPHVKINSRVSGGLTTNTAGQEEYLIIFHSGSCLRGVQIGSDNTMYDQGVDSLNIGSTMSSGPLGLALNLRNVARADQVCGSVRVIVSPAPLTLHVENTNPNKVTSAMIENLRAMFNQDPNVKTYTSEHFRTTKTIGSFPANAVAAMDYQDFEVVAARDGSHASLNNNREISAALRACSMAMIIVEFPIADAANRFEYTIHSCDRVRFSLDSIMSTMHTNPAPMTLDHHNQAVRAAAATAGVAHDLPTSMQ
jgi:hypothetical protein